MEDRFTMNNTTYSVKKNDIERKWYIIDAEGKSLGRVAAEAAKLTLEEFRKEILRLTDFTIVFI